MIIAIDGPVGVGKSTVAREVARRLGFLHIDTGAMYRAIAYKALKQQITLENQPVIRDLAQQTCIELNPTPQGLQVLMDGDDITKAIRTPEIDSATPAIADNVEVRKILVQQQQYLGTIHDVVMEGRDIGTVVFPHAELKIYLNAAIETRAARRAKDMEAQGFEYDYDELVNTVRQRDERDRTRTVGALRQAQDARTIDTTDMTFEQVVNTIVEMARELPLAAKELEG